MITTVDVGATKTLISQFKDSHTPVNRIRFETPHIAADFVRVLNTHLASLNDITALAIGIAGQISDDGGAVLYCGNMPWRNVPLRKMLADHYNCPVYLANDAAMAGLGEMNILTPVPHLGFYLALGTGIGGAIIVDGKLAPRLTHSEVGHIPLRTDAGWKEWEDIASGRAIVAQFGKLAQDLTEPEQWQWIAENLAQGLAPIIATLQPQVVVVGGGVGGHFEKFRGLLTEKIHRRLPAFITIPNMLGAQHADDAVLYGGYYYALHQQGR